MALEPPPLARIDAAHGSAQSTAEEKRKARITVACHRAGESREEQLADVRCLLEMLGEVEPRRGPRLRRGADGRARPRPVRRHVLDRVQRMHPDGTVCRHRVTNTGRATQPGCGGRGWYSCACFCGWSAKGPVRAVVAAERAAHQASTAPTAPATDEGGETR